MELKHDKTADAIYMKLSNKPYAYGKDLDDLRRIDYDAHGNPRGVELLCVSKGVNLEGLPQIDEIAGTLEAEGIRIYVIEQQLSITWQSYSGAFSWQDYSNIFNVMQGRGEPTRRLVEQQEEVTA